MDKKEYRFYEYGRRADAFRLFSFAYADISWQREAVRIHILDQKKREKEVEISGKVVYNKKQCYYMVLIEKSKNIRLGINAMGKKQTRVESDEIDLLKLFFLLINKLHLIVLSALIVGVAAYLATLLFVTPQYTATTRLYVNNTTSKESGTMITQSDLNASMQLVDTYSAIITSNGFMNEVIETSELAEEITAEQMIHKVKISAVNNTEVFNVSVEDADPKAAARIANAIADLAPKQISKIVEGSSVEVVDYATIPTRITSPNYRKNAMMGILLGGFLCCAVIVLLGLMDTTIQSEADLEEMELPILGIVPDFDQVSSGGAYSYGYGKKRGDSK